jgi:hypothetical protein
MLRKTSQANKGAATVSVTGEFTRVVPKNSISQPGKGYFSRVEPGL